MIVTSLKLTIYIILIVPVIVVYGFLLASWMLSFSKCVDDKLARLDKWLRQTIVYTIGTLYIFVWLFLFVLTILLLSKVNLK